MFHSVTAKILDILERTIIAETSTADKLAVLFSGGIDSTILALIAGRFKKIVLYTVAMEGSHDEIWASRVAKEIKLQHTIIKVEPSRFEDSYRKIIAVLPELNMLQKEVETVMLLAISSIREEYIISGQGADELFGGYKRYLSMSEQDFMQNSQNDYKKLFFTNVVWDRKIAEPYRKKIVYPYLGRELIELNIPYEYKIHNETRKYILRNLALTLGLPPDIAFTEKKAAQYSSGIDKAAKKLKLN